MLEKLTLKYIEDINEHNSQSIDSIVKYDT